MEIILATGNKGKLKEMRGLLSGIDVNLNVLDFNEVAEPEETGLTFEENSIIKSEYYSSLTNGICVSDDSGLVIPVLNGDPGIYSSRWAGPEKDFNSAIQKIRNRMLQKGVFIESGVVDAFFYCSIAIKVPNEAVKVFVGKVDGKLVYPGRGCNGFGYDSIFIPFGSSVTYAEMTFLQKSADNHRFRAAVKLKDYINSCKKNTSVV